MRLGLILALILYGFGLHAQPSIEQIDQICTSINSALNQYQEVINKDINVYKDTNQENYSYESIDIHQLAIINLVRYYDSQQIKKAIAVFEGDRQDLRSEYYFHEGDLIFIAKTYTYYKKPKWSDGFNENEYSLERYSYYFYQEKLVSWFSADQTELDPSEMDKTMVSQLLSDATLYLKIEQ